MSKNTTHIRTTPKAKDELHQWVREASLVEGKDIRMSEALERIATSQRVREMFLQDAARRRFRQ